MDLREVDIRDVDLREGPSADGPEKAAKRHTLAWLLLLFAALGLCGLPAVLSPRAVCADEEEADEGAADPEEEGDEPIERNIEASRESFEKGDLHREEQIWSEAATAYWKAVEADLENYLAHVRYQETGRKAGDDLDTMRSDYDSFKEDYPRNLSFKLHRLRLNPAAGRLQALEALKKVHGKSSDVHLEIGRAHLAAGAAKPALEALKVAFALKVGKRPDVLLLLAEAEWAVGRHADAIARLDAAVKADAEFFPARLMLARCQMLAGTFEDSATNAEIVIQQRPTYMAAFLVLSEALSSKGDIEAAKKTLDAAYRVSKSVPDVTIALADLWARLEDDEFMKKEGGEENPHYKQALKLYTEVLAEDEENWRALYGSAWVLERQAKFDEAEEKYREVAAIIPDSVMTVNSIGFCLFKQGRVTEAQVQFKRALDMDAEFVTALANLGSTYDAQAKYKDAIKLYEKILKKKEHKNYLRAIINCAFDREALGSFPKALKLLMRAHGLLPEDANIVVWIGDNHYFSKKWKDAEKWYQKSVGMDEKSFFGWRGLGLTLSQRRKWADAVNALEKASKLKPDDLDMYVMLGDIYFMELKDLEKALKHYQEYIQRGGSDPDVQDAIIEIKKALEK